ncbi:MAG: response regulator transcription factor [Lachnospiraceae bacterium]|nr:response regulator transcription factor [Lachnospiraceae bacterium]
MRIAICDDSRRSQALFTSALGEFDPRACAECFTNGAELLEAVQEPPVFDIVFLDIYLPGESGIDIARKIQKLSPQTGIVFITCSLDFAVDAYSLNALHYLVKPITADGVAEAFQRLQRLRSKLRPLLSLTIGRDNVTMYLDEIICILSARHNKEIYLTNNRTIQVRSPLQELEDKLDKNFLRLSRGTIANMEHIRQMSADYCLMDNGMRLDFPRRGKVGIRADYDAWLFSRLYRDQ